MIYEIGLESPCPAVLCLHIVLLLDCTGASQAVQLCQVIKYVSNVVSKRLALGRGGIFPESTKSRLNLH